MAALTYEESASLMADLAFRGRVKVACITYARFIGDEAADVPAHSTRVKWSQATLLNPDFAAAQVTPTTVMDPAVQQAGSAITDAALQGSVETSVNKIL